VYKTANKTHQKTKENVMKKTSVNTGKTLKVLSLVISLGAMPLLLGVTGCTTGSRYEQSSGERIDDHDTSSRVRAALADDSQYKYDGVNVETFKGVVQLSGFVNTRDQKDRAGDLARKVSGVHDVENNITVKE
jgi:osmotically-inducible protein OsmY